MIISLWESITIYTKLFTLSFTLLIYIPIFHLLISALLFLVTIYLLVQVSKNKKKDYPIAFKALLYLLVLSFALIFLLTLLSNQLIYSYGLVVVLFAYMYVTGVFVYYLINVLYYWRLKKMFPFEREPEENSFIQISRRRLSKYMELDKQKIFLI
ncbi:phosphatidylglycerophosphate synthase [Amphibacillus cookii]|nr:phosphatidylglycerophosphate synthase [Amphibacillus cookii]